LLKNFEHSKGYLNRLRRQDREQKFDEDRSHLDTVTSNNHKITVSRRWQDQRYHISVRHILFPITRMSSMVEVGITKRS